MAFFFKSKKSQPPPSALPPALRTIHTSDGTTHPSALNGFSDKPIDRPAQSPPPNPSANNSFTSLNKTVADPDPQIPRRDRSESDAGVRRNNVNGQAPNAALYPWSQRRLAFPTPQSNPFPRYGAAVNAVASKDGDLYMMGGLINGSIVKGDLWMVESGGGNLSCYPIATVSEGPGPRVGHASLLVGNAFIVFGGDTKMDDSDTLDDTLYLLNTSSRQWSRAAPPGARPAGRYGHTLNILGSRIYIFGGQVEGYFFNDLLAFDLNALQNPANAWEFLIQNTAEGGPSQGPVPPARTNHSVVSYNDQLYLFGGTNGTQWYNDVWTFDPRTTSWSQQDCIGYIPAPREGHSAALVNDVMYIFGGRTEEGTDLGDLAAFRISSRRWYTFQNMGPSPSPRSGHSMTAHGKQIIVLAGEPSSAPRDASELSMVYILDTAKIRYPNDQPTPTPRPDGQGGPVRRPSTEIRNPPGGRSFSREGHSVPMGPLGRSGSAAREIAPSPVGARQVEDVTGNNGPPSRPPRSSIAQAPAGPPPTGQAPTPLTNGVAAGRTSPRAKAPAVGVDTRGPVAETPRPQPVGGRVQSPVAKESPKEAARSSRDASPGFQGRRTPSQQSAKAKAMEAAEAAALVHGGGGPSRQRSLRSQRGQGSIDSSEEGLLGRSGSGKHQMDGGVDAKSLRSIGDEPRSPRLTAHQEALMKELEATKSRNAWYASELALARKAGYQTTSATSPTFEDKAVGQFADDDRPLIEAFMNMRAELARMQQTVDQQASTAARTIAEVEHQRDAAVSEAAYARAKLAAHSGSQNSTPQPDATRDLDEHNERSTDISRRLALALALQSEHKAKLESLSNDLFSEKRAREIAEESAEASHQRLEEISAGRDPMEVEALRSDLHEAQRTAREEAGLRAQVEEKHRMLQVERDDLAQKHENASTLLKDHPSSMAALEAAVTASSDKAALLERQVEQERQQREAVERKLGQLKSEHEERTNELEHTTRRLRDAEDLADNHAKEASTHRTALLAGLSKMASPDQSTGQDPLVEQRISVLQQSTNRAHSLATQNKEAADLAASKLRGAEERIAGLEAYQVQSSREGLQIRKQLQTALKDLQAHQAENRSLKTSLESQQRDTSALAVQHGALKDLLGERGISMSDARRSPMFDNSPNSRFGTPELSRLRELEHQLQSSQKAHEETRQAFETREHEADRTYREKLEQLENDYQSAVHYVKGTERMLKKMKEELSKYKTLNTKLETDLESMKGSERSVGESEHSINALKSEHSTQLAALEMKMTSVQRELASVQAERDLHQSKHAQLSERTEQNEKELVQLKSENSLLESRAADAEKKVTMLLEQVGQTVTNYRRQSQMRAANGVNHQREPSESTAATETSSTGEDGLDNRGSLALDNLTSELDALKSHWESTNRNYRLSSQFDFERSHAQESAGGELSDSLANWRRRLDEEEHDSGSATSAVTEVARPREAGMI